MDETSESIVWQQPPSLAACKWQQESSSKVMGCGMGFEGWEDIVWYIKAIHGTCKTHKNTPSSTLCVCFLLVQIKDVFLWCFYSTMSSHLLDHDPRSVGMEPKDILIFELRFMHSVVTCTVSITETRESEGTPSKRTLLLSLIWWLPWHLLQ